jgi:hypothetical protein
MLPGKVARTNITLLLVSVTTGATTQFASSEKGCYFQIVNVCYQHYISSANAIRTVICIGYYISLIRIKS